jgi:hypothetical protein
MIEALAGISQRGPDILKVQIRQLFYHLLGGEAAGQQIQDITDSNP